MCACMWILGHIHTYIHMCDMCCRQEFGFKYENYMLYTGRVCSWLQLYRRIAIFVANMQRGTPKTSFFPRLLTPPIKDYDGTMAITADSNMLLWENGEWLEAIDLRSHTRKFRQAVWGPRTPTSHPCLVNNHLYVFLHLNALVSVYELDTGDRYDLVRLGRQGRPSLRLGRRDGGDSDVCGGTVVSHVSQ
eukprot:GHVU01110728.1.p1 GENE.GHVU01110728.1~~GHVU01110728.1.p1  ORF type:complete len:190 (-),score=24.79 GHVU01110728.1:103-672(-)